ncbi:MAG: molybdopterin-dependent oxidoreductase [Hyphomicrobiales bacterium]|nr:molybdopterin-dependent oxidoreductase [Hyphomicrobiales bacterium]
MSSNRQVRTYCRSCHANCGVLVEVDEQETVLGIRGDPEHPRSHGFMCPKGLQMVWGHNRPDRLDCLTVDGLPTEWEAGLDDLAARIRRAIDQHGPDAFGFYAGTGADELGYNALRRMTAALGSQQHYTASTVDIAPVLKASELVTGYAGGLKPDLDYFDEDLKLIVFFGSNPIVSHAGADRPTDGARMIRAFRSRGGKTWAFDPVRTRTAILSDHHVAPIPGTDPVIMAWLARELLENLPPDAPALATTRRGDRDRLAKALEPFQLEPVARIAGVEPSVLQALLADIRETGRLAVVCGTGVRFGPDALVGEWLAWVLLILSDSLEQPGGMWISTNWLSPVENRKWNPAPEGGHVVSAPATRPELPRTFGQTACAALLDEIEHGSLKTFIVHGGSPLTALPEPDRLEAGLRSLDALAVLDVIATPLTEMATHVLAVTGRLERADYNSIQAHHPQYTDAVVSPKPGRLHSWYIVGQLAKRLGVGDKVFSGLDPDTVTEEELLAQFVAGARNSFDELKKAGPLGIHFAERGGVRWALETAVPDKTWRLAPESLVDRLSGLLVERTSPGFPLLLCCGRQVRRMNTHQNVENQRHSDKPQVHLSVADAETFGVGEGDFVSLRSAHGFVVAEATIDKDIRPGAITLGHGWYEANVSRLTTSREVDPLTTQPQMSAIPVAMEARR